MYMYIYKYEDLKICIYSTTDVFTTNLLTAFRRLHRAVGPWFSRAPPPPALFKARLLTY